jgi:hypothetical protein
MNGNTETTMYLGTALYLSGTFLVLGVFTSKVRDGTGVQYEVGTIR